MQKKIGKILKKMYYPRDFLLQVPVIGVAKDLYPPFISAKNQKFIKNTLKELFLGHHLVLNTFKSVFEHGDALILSYCPKIIIKNIIQPHFHPHKSGNKFMIPEKFLATFMYLCNKHIS